MNNILDARKEAINNERKKVATKQKVNNLRCFGNRVSRAFFGVTGGILLLGGMPIVGVSFLATALASHIGLQISDVEENNKLEFLAKEEEHIKNLKNTQLNGSRELTARRIRKVNELEARKANTSSKKNFSKFAYGLSTLFQWGALGATLVSPALGWVSVAACAAKYLTGKSKNEAAKEDDKLALRINNLNLDLELTRAKNPTPRAAGEINDRVVEKIEENQTVKEKAPCSLEDEMLVDKYIASLEGIGEEEKAKQYIK